MTVRAAAEGSSTSSMASPATANAKVARKKPNATLVTPDRTNVRITRGESCELASCRPTRVIAKTTPTKVSIDEAITPSMVSAVEVLIVRPRPQSAGSPTTWGCATTTATSTPPTTSSRGMNQKPSRTHSDVRTLRCAQWDPAANACMRPCWPDSRRRATRAVSAMERTRSGGPPCRTQPTGGRDSRPVRCGGRAGGQTATLTGKVTIQPSVASRTAQPARVMTQRRRRLWSLVLMPAKNSTTA